MFDRTASWSDLLAGQAGIATRVDLRAAGLTRDQLRAQLRASRWRLLNERVVCLHNGPLTGEQAEWAAVLSAAARVVALAGPTAVTRLGVTGFSSETVHVLVERGARVLPVDGVDVAVHESRRFGSSDVLPRRPPVTRLERATIDTATWAPDVATALRCAVAPIQQRRTSAVRLREALTAAGQIRYGATLRALVADLEGGAEALSEVTFLRWCRRHHLPQPRTQVRLDGSGRRRYLDATFEGPDGKPVYVEIDGGVHLSLTTRWLDTAKDNDAVIAGRTTLRFPSVAIYLDDPVALRQLRQALGSVSTTGR